MGDSRIHVGGGARSVRLSILVIIGVALIVATGWSLVANLGAASGSGGAADVQREVAAVVTDEGPLDLPDVAPATIGADLTGAQLEDLAFLAAENDMSLDEAISRYGWEESFSILVQDLKTSFPDIYAGARIEASGNPWIAFKSDVPAQAFVTVLAFNSDVLSGNADGPFAASGVSVEMVADRGFTEAELDAKLVAAHFDAIEQADLVSNASSGYDIETGIVVVEIEPNTNARASTPADLVAQLRSRSDAFGGVIIRVVEQVRVGDTHVYGGHAMGGCTSGFTVTKGSTRGIANAAHCSDTLSYHGYSGTLQGQHDGAWGDVQWFTTSHYEVDDFYSGSSTAVEVNKRDVSGRGNAVTGQSLCRNGKTTFKECDTVYQLNHCSWDTCRLTAMHNMEGSGGDSGGPWFWGNTAYGIHQGWKFWNFKFRDLFTPQQYIDDGLPGVTVATS